MNIENNKPVNNIIRYTVVFYRDDEPREVDWGSNDVMFEIVYNSKYGIAEVYKIGGFGDATLEGQFWDKRGRGITLDEMLENIKEISEMSYKEFKKIILRKE